MENIYGIGITNRYHLFLDEDEDPLEVLKVQEQQKELRKKTKLSEKENKGKQEIKGGKAALTTRKGIKETQNIKAQDPHQKPKEENGKAKGLGRPTSDRKFENREERNNQRNRPDKLGIGGDNQRDERGDKRFERRNFGDSDKRNFGDGERRNFGDSDRRNFGDGHDRRNVGDVDGQRDGGRGRSSLGSAGIGGGRGLGRGRGKGGRGGFDGRGKREFDRQSGSDKTGIKAVDKRDGAGPHNWGSHRDAMDEAESVNRPADDSAEWVEKTDSESPVTDNSGTEPKEPTVGQNGVDGEEADPAPSAEEERKELTLDEWKALKGNRSKPQYNLRKAGEGEDLSQWKKMYALQKKKEEEEDDEDEEYDSADYPQRVGRQKRVLDIEYTFTDARVGGRGRGGRGAGRGAPRGAMRPPPRGSSSDNSVLRDPERDSGPRIARPSVPKTREREPVGYGGAPRNSRQSAPKVDDEHDFPSLG